jgi:hypothetical protein
VGVRFLIEAVPSSERQHDLPVAEAAHAAVISDRAGVAVAVGTQCIRQRCRLGRAYRAGRLVCGWVQVSISDDERLGLTEQERRLVRVRFHEPIDDGLRSDLTVLLRRRGASAARVAERIDPIEIVVDDPHGERERIRGRIAPPQAHHGPLRDIEFALRTLETTR